MPDKTRNTVSASEAPALFGQSPYLTRWMLFQRFSKGIDLVESNSRMTWGKKMQPLLIEQAAGDLKLECRPNSGDEYVTRGLVGCTRDGEIICPDRGPGSLETKCCFDYQTWMRDWQGGRMVPRHIEIQLQTQMMIGASNVPFRWGVIAVWVCGDMLYFEREPIPDLWLEINKEAARFLDDVKERREPNAFGLPIEAPLIAKLYPTPTMREVDFRGDENAGAYADEVRYLIQAQADSAFWDNEAKRMKAKFLALLKDADRGVFADGVTVDIARTARKGFEVKPTTVISVKPYARDSNAMSGPPKHNPTVIGAG